MSGYRSGGNVGRVVTRSNVAGSSLVGSTTVTGNAATTSWGQVTASLAADSLITKVHVACSGNTVAAGTTNTVDIAIGGAGSEVVIGTEPLLPSIAGTGTQFFAVAEVVVPLRVASGQRVAARITSPSGLNGASIAVDVFGVASANLETL